MHPRGTCAAEHAYSKASIAIGMSSRTANPMLTFTRVIACARTCMCLPIVLKMRQNLLCVVELLLERHNLLLPEHRPIHAHTCTGAWADRGERPSLASIHNGLAAALRFLTCSRYSLSLVTSETPTETLNVGISWARKQMREPEMSVAMLKNTSGKGDTHEMRHGYNVIDVEYHTQ